MTRKKSKPFWLMVAYSGESFAQSVQETIDAKVQVAKRSELHKLALISKRWLGERSFAWIEQCRRLWKTVKENSITVCTCSFLPLSDFFS